MPEPMSLMEFLQELVSDPGTRADFLADPHGTLAGHGLAHLSPADVHDALVLVEDTRTTDFDPHGGVTTGFGPPPLPAEGDHADAVQYLSGYLADASAAATGPDPIADPGFGEDVDAGLPDLPSPGTGHDDATSFGSGDTAGGYADPDGSGTPAPTADEDLFGHRADVDAHLDAGMDGTGDSTGMSTGMDDDSYHLAGSADPYPDAHPHDAGAPVSHLYDVDF